VAPVDDDWSAFRKVEVAARDPAKSIIQQIELTFAEAGRA
jgi:hypothetical protein